MIAALASLNYLAVIVVTIVGFMIGALWFTVLFGQAWMAEMKIDKEAMKNAPPKMAPLLGKGLLLTLVSTFALAWILHARGTAGAWHGAEWGAMLGLLLVGARFANAGVWERRSLRLLTMNVGHEVVMFAVQGAILGVWH